MAAAWRADIAIVVIEAPEGLQKRARRHLYLASLLRIPRILLAVDRMDRVGHAQDAFRRIEADCRAFASRIGLAQLACIPVSIARGDNVASPQGNTPWYEGPTLLGHLDSPSADHPAAPDVRGIAGTVAGEPVAVADQFEATVVWMGGEPLLRGRDYLLEIGGRTVAATVAPIKYRLDVDTQERLAAEKLERDEIGVCELELGEPVAFEPYCVNRELGRFVLLDRITGGAVGAGVLHFALRRSQNVRWQSLDIDRSARASIKGQRPFVVWFTGLSGAGKSTIANLVEKRLHALGRHTYLLDGDNVRHGLNKDLGFTAEDRVENIRRVAEVAALMADAGLVVLAAFISPFRSERRMARALLPEGEFVEVFIDTPLEVAEARDAKGLYRKARRGELANFTGIDSPYERPEAAEVTIPGALCGPEEAAERIVAELRRRGVTRTAIGREA
jgi:bifunctional enzyme CysN/CysC